jgi:hypothetical protein
MNCQYRKRRQEMAPESPTKRQQQMAEYVQSVKSQCLGAYGGVCRCGEVDPVVLTLDHVNDDGSVHRQETGTRGLNFYFHLRKNGFPTDRPLQVLCMNCQFAKREAAEDVLEGENRRVIGLVE